MRIYLIRHAQCELNVLLDDAAHTKRLSKDAFNLLISDDASSPLTPEGIVQAQQLAERLAEIRFDYLYTSPFERALATATALGKATNLTPQIVEELRELRTAQLREGSRELTLRQIFWRSYTRMLFSPASPDALGLVYRRARTVWAQITHKPAETVAVVSHGMFIYFLLLSVWADRRWRIISRDFRNCGISLVERRG
jgi:broad specificity phosphatase PhoE